LEVEISRLGIAYLLNIAQITYLVLGGITRREPRVGPVNPRVAAQVRPVVVSCKRKADERRYSVLGPHLLNRRIGTLQVVIRIGRGPEFRKLRKGVHGYGINDRHRKPFLKTEIPVEPASESVSVKTYRS